MLLKTNIEFPELTKELCNTRTGEKRLFTMRPFAPGDERGMIACIRDEYGDSYFKRDFYDVEKLREKAQGGHYVFFVAETDTGTADSGLQRSWWSIRLNWQSRCSRRHCSSMQ